MFAKMLIPCDVSYGSHEWLDPTISAAWDLAQKYNSHLTFVTVVPESLLRGFYPNIYDSGIAKDALQTLKTIVDAKISDSSRADCIVREGGICPEIIHAAKEHEIDLVAMTSHGPKTRDYLLGSNAAHVALHVPCSVLILRV